MRKRTSRRRWKRRCAIGRLIPRVAVVEHQLTRWFAFSPANYNVDAYYATPWSRRMEIQGTQTTHDWMDHD